MKFPIGLDQISGHVCLLANPNGSPHGGGPATASFTRCRSQGVYVLRKGDSLQCSCPVSPQIKTGSGKVRIGGQPVALANNSETNHQSFLLSGSTRVFVNE